MSNSELEFPVGDTVGIVPLTSDMQWDTAQYSGIQHRTALRSAAQCSTAQIGIAHPEEKEEFRPLCLSLELSIALRTRSKSP